MPVGYTAMFAEKLAESSRLKVREAFEGCVVKAGEALIARAGRHLSFRKNAGGADSSPLVQRARRQAPLPIRGCPFSIGGGNGYGPRVLGVVMTGMGDDGKQGAAWIKAQGGTVITEAEESCVIYGMPRSVVESGLSDGPQRPSRRAGR